MHPKAKPCGNRNSPYPSPTGRRWARTCHHLHPTQETWKCLSPSPLKFLSFLPSNGANFSSTFKPHSCLIPNPPGALPPAFPLLLFLSSLPTLGRGQVLPPLGNLISLPLTFVSGPQGYSEVGKPKIELRKMERVDGVLKPRFHFCFLLGGIDYLTRNA